MVTQKVLSFPSISISTSVGDHFSEQIRISKHKKGALYHQYDWNFHKMIVYMLNCSVNSPSRTTKNWMLAWNTSCHVTFTLQPVELQICCKIDKLAGSFSKARAGQSACCLSNFFLWPIMSSSVCPLPKSRKWRKHSETTGSVMLIFCHFMIAWRVT